MEKQRTEEVRKILEQHISEDLSKKLDTTKNDVEFCKMLADNGIDVEKLQRALPDDFMAKVSGGYRYYNQNVYCPNCKNGVEDRISYQFFKSLWNWSDRYRCRDCGTYFQIDDNGSPYIV